MQVVKVLIQVICTSYQTNIFEEFASTWFYCGFRLDLLDVYFHCKLISVLEWSKSRSKEWVCYYAVHL